MSANDHRFIICSCLAGLCSLMALLHCPLCWLICTCGFSIIGGLYGLGNLLRVPYTRLNFLMMSAVVISLASASGLLFGFLAISWVSSDLWAITVAYAYTTVTDLALTQGYTSLFAGTLWLLGKRLHTTEKMAVLHERVHVSLHTYRPTVLLLVFAIFASQLYLFNRNVIVYGGHDLAHEGEPTHPLLAMISPLIPLVPFVLGYYTIRCLQTRHWITGFLFGVLLLGELSWFFLFGRRSVLYFFVLLLAGLTYDWVITPRSIVVNIVPVCLGALMILTIADTYHKLRTVYGFETLQRMSIVDGLNGLQSVDTEQYAGIRTMNMALRSGYSSLALGQFVNLFRTTAYKPLGGQVLANSIRLATPSDFILDKKTVLAKEALYQRAYPLALTDISETICLESFIDFGWPGALLYAGFMFMLFTAIYQLAHDHPSPLFSLVVSCLSVSLALSMIETDMITFLATVRTLVVYYVVTRLFSKKAVGSAQASGGEELQTAGSL